MSVLSGSAEMPSNPRGYLLDLGGFIIPAESIAREVGNAKTSNVVLLGALSSHLDIDETVWYEAITARVPPKTIDVNLEAFKAGRAFVVEKEGE